MSTQRENPIVGETSPGVPKQSSTFHTHLQHLTVPYRDSALLPKPLTTHDVAVAALAREWTVDYQTTEVAPGAGVVTIKDSPARLVRVEVLEGGLGTFTVFDSVSSATDEIFSYTGPVEPGQVFEIDRPAFRGITFHVPEGGPALKIFWTQI